MSRAIWDWGFTRFWIFDFGLGIDKTRNFILLYLDEMNLPAASRGVFLKVKFILSQQAAGN
jgi:hypothetical protein